MWRKEVCEKGKMWGREGRFFFGRKREIFLEGRGNFYKRVDGDKKREIEREKQEADIK